MLPSSRPYDDFVPQPPFYRDSEPQFKCQTRECDSLAFREGDHHRCEVCTKRFCGDCLTKFEDLLFCGTCCVCDTCQQPAIALCVDGGELVCEAHSSPRGRKARLCEKCKADPGDLPSAAYDVDNGRDL